MNDSDFPKTPDALSAAWLGEVLNAPIRAFTTQPLGEGVGVIGQVNRITVEEEAGSVRTIIGKFASPFEENRATANAYSMYLTECDFYRYQAGTLPVAAPHCLHVESDPEDQCFVLLLEFLDGFDSGDQILGATREQAEKVVDMLAAMHGATWGGQDENTRRFKLHHNPAQVAGMAAGTGIGWPNVQENMDALLTDTVRRIGPRISASAGALVALMEQGPLCLVHGDVRFDNVMTNAAGDIVMVDWQAVSRSNGEHDLAYFITQSLTAELQAEISDALIERYHEGLVRAGVTDHSLEACHARFRNAALYMLCYAIIIAGTLDMGNERGRALGEALLQRACAAMERLDVEPLLDAITRA